MDIHGYIHGWILDFSHPVDISMDIVLSHLIIKLNIQVFYLNIIFFCLYRSYSLFCRLFMLLSQMNNQ